MSDTTKETIVRLRAACDALDGLSIHNDWECRMVRATALPKLLDAVEDALKARDDMWKTLKQPMPAPREKIREWAGIITDALAGMEDGNE